MKVFVACLGLTNWKLPPHNLASVTHFAYLWGQLPACDTDQHAPKPKPLLKINWNIPMYLECLPFSFDAVNIS